METLASILERVMSALHLEASASWCKNLTTIPSHLGTAGLLALADINTIPLRTALTGTSSWLDIFILAPGLHKQSTAPDLNKGEYPACAAMTTGPPGKTEVGSVGSGFAYMSAVLLSLAIFATTVLIGDIVTIAVLTLLLLNRLINVSIIRRRARPGWFGAPEPGVNSDLLVLLSQDRWFRIQGATYDVKAVTSGTWLRDATFLESSLVSFATLLTYLSAAISINATPSGKVALLILFVGNAALLGLANESTKSLTMFSRTLSIKHPPKPYARRLDLTHELVREFKRTDCFVAMGMIQPDKEAEFQKSYKGAVVM
ncbi:hypothetical protein PRZ48_002520 [Zasmidium cellare]|uniref:Uncharacterized protein n=1 Tax=Zasmidium cellare TaxID=395010 RepID=A0ABR0F6F9_ZASCE|nr:hypothetical protein PRZ48_002520 [Zasmidium cellare]